jgi:hypothetical protein
LTSAASKEFCDGLEALPFLDNEQFDSLYETLFTKIEADVVANGPDPNPAVISTTAKLIDMTKESLSKDDNFVDVIEFPGD